MKRILLATTLLTGICGRAAAQGAPGGVIPPVILCPGPKCTTMVAPETYGAQGDGQQPASTYTMPIGSNTLSAAAAIFKAANSFGLPIAATSPSGGASYIEIPGAGSVVSTLTGASITSGTLSAGTVAGQALYLGEVITGAGIPGNVSLSYPVAGSNNATWVTSNATLTVGAETISGVAALATGIASYVDSQHITTTGTAVTGISGATETITYGHDDTAAMGTATALNVPVLLTSGHTYLVKNVTSPSSSVGVAGNGGTSGFVSEGGLATLRAIAGGTSTYLAASQNWINNAPYSDNGIYCQNVVFDGGQWVRDSFVLQTWASQLINCHADNALRHGWWLARTTSNGSTLLNTTENNQFLLSDGSNNGSDGIHGDTTGPTDSQIDNGYFHGNGGWGIYAGIEAGWQIQNIHTYSNQSGGLSADNFYGNVVNNHFEDQVNIGSLQITSKTAILGPGNQFGGLVTFAFVDNVSYEAAESLGNLYYDAGEIFQKYNGSGHTIYSVNDVFTTNTPFTWNGGFSSNGVIIAENDFAQGSAFANAGQALLDGYQTPSNTSQGANKLSLRKVSANASTSDTYTLTVQTEGVSGAGFTATGTISDVSYVGTATVESYVASFALAYSRTGGTISTSSSPTITVLQDTGSGISTTATLTNTNVASNTNTATVVFTITHPAAGDAGSSWSKLDVGMSNRLVQGTYLQ